VIFSDDVGAERIEKQFLEDLHFEITHDEKRRLDRSNIIEFGKTVKGLQKNLKGEDDWIVGCKNLVISMDEIMLALNKRCFDGKYILVLAEPEWALLEWDGRDHTTRKNLLAKSNCIFSSNVNTRDWALGLKEPPLEIFVAEFGSLKPCIHGSDSHCFERLCLPNENRFCWIKGDVSFEGLKQIMYEPSDRVRIQSENPQERKNVYSIASIKIKECKVNDELTIAESEIGFTNQCNK
jgi:hypothetical protein